ncbi:MAG: hypothetical protein U9N87_00365 [Planctomycetota bacterium]|nr:hypothetical protein [Planctomycetota bacterium]
MSDDFDAALTLADEQPDVARDDYFCGGLINSILGKQLLKRAVSRVIRGIFSTAA